MSGLSPEVEVADVVRSVAARFNATLSADEVAAAAAVILGVIDLATGSSLKRAAAAGRAAADAITTADQAEKAAMERK